MNLFTYTYKQEQRLARATTKRKKVNMTIYTDENFLKNEIALCLLADPTCLDQVEEAQEAQEAQDFTNLNEYRIDLGGCYLAVDNFFRSIEITEKPSKGNKTVKQKAWTNINWLVRSLGISNFLTENLVNRATREALQGSTYQEAVQIIEDRLQNAKNTYLASLPEIKGDIAKTIQDQLYTNEYYLKANQIKPIDYKDIYKSVASFSVDSDWETGRIFLASDYDEFMHHVEGQRAFYTTKTHASARKLWKLMKDIDLTRFESGEDFLNFLSKKRVGIQYVPTCWR